MRQSKYTSSNSIFFSFSLYCCTTRVSSMPSVLIYINNPSNYIVPTAKQSTDHTMLFFIPCNAKTSTNELNSTLKNKFECRYQWKIYFRLDLNK